MKITSSKKKISLSSQDCKKLEAEFESLFIEADNESGSDEFSIFEMNNKYPNIVRLYELITKGK